MEGSVQPLRKGVTMNTQNPNHEIAEVLYRLNVGRPVTDLIENAFHLLLTDPYVKSRDAQLGAFLSGLMVQGVSASEVEILIRTALNIDGLPRYKIAVPDGERLIAVAGSGKKGLKTFNISTPSCIAAAAAGAYVVKPGSKATSSVSGSVDFLCVVGARPLALEDMSNVLLATKFGFFPIEGYIPKFDAVYGGKTFGPTPLSFALPAIANPIVCDALLYGLSHPNVALSLEVLGRFRIPNVLVVASSLDDIHFIDELAPFPANYIGRIENDEVHGVEKVDVTTFMHGAYASAEDIRPAASLIENIQRSVMALAGRDVGPREDVIALNAAAILLLAKKVASLEDGFAMIRELIRNGVVLQKLKEFILATGGTLHSINTLLGDKHESNTC
jgi:anthranilate phosphoribosyltransferase